MTVRHAITLGRAAFRATQRFLDRRIRFPRARLGNVLEFADGETFVLYRETMLETAAAPSDDRVVLLFRLEVSDPETGTILRAILFDPLANVATPFFAGLPGFRRKLWLAGERRGEFLELYEWASKADAERFVDVLAWLLAPFTFLASPRFEIVEDNSVDEYVAGRAVEWRQESKRARQLRRRSEICSAMLVIGFAVALKALGRVARRCTLSGGE